MQTLKKVVLQILVARESWMQEQDMHHRLHYAPPWIFHIMLLFCITGTGIQQGKKVTQNTFLSLSPVICNIASLYISAPIFTCSGSIPSKLGCGRSGRSEGALSKLVCSFNTIRCWKRNHSLEKSEYELVVDLVGSLLPLCLCNHYFTIIPYIHLCKLTQLTHC